ncbi:unnamed protein product [Heterobilharzia americana]|nr:unnamed protein product [Heterobilharzia americana]
MFSLFALGGLIELCIFYGVLKIPIQSEFLFNMIALFAELFLFLFHLHGRSSLDVYLHLLLCGMIVLAIGISFAELVSPHEPIYGLVRNWTILMQGTWFWQVGAILYPKFSWMPTWDQTATESIPAATNLFAYHMLANFFAIILIALLVAMHTKIGLMSDETMKRNLSTAVAVTMRRECQRDHHQAQTDSQQHFITDNDSEEIEMWNCHRSGTHANAESTNVQRNIK